MSPWPAVTCNAVHEVCKPLLCLVTNGTDAITVHDQNSPEPQNRSTRRFIRPRRTHGLRRWHYARLSPHIHQVHIVMIILHALHPLSLDAIQPAKQWARYRPQGSQWSHPTFHHATWGLHAIPVLLSNDILPNSSVIAHHILVSNDVYPHRGPHQTPTHHFITLNLSGPHVSRRP